MDSNGKNHQNHQNGLQQQPPPNCFRFRGVDSHQEVITGYKEGLKVFKGTYYCQVKLVQARELDLAVAQVHVKTLETKIELLNLNYSCGS
jgi:hypothetical protein